MWIKSFIRGYISFLKSALRPPLLVVVCSLLVLGPYVRAQLLAYEIVQRKAAYGDSLARAGAALTAEFFVMALVAFSVWPWIRRAADFYGFAWVGLVCSVGAESAFFIKNEAAWPNWVAAGIGSGLLLAVAARLVGRSKERGKTLAGILSGTSLLGFLFTLILPGGGDPNGLLHLHAVLIVFLTGSLALWRRVKSADGTECTAAGSHNKRSGDRWVAFAALTVAVSIGVLASAALLQAGTNSEQEANVSRVILGLGLGVIGSLVFEFMPGNQRGIARFALLAPVLAAVLGLWGGDAGFHAVSLISVAAFYLIPWLCECQSSQGSGVLILSVLPLGIALGSWLVLVAAADANLSRALIGIPILATAACLVVAWQKRRANPARSGHATAVPMPNHA